MNGMFDLAVVGTATRDVFLSGAGFKVLNDKDYLERAGFQTGEAQCFSLGSKIEVGRPVFAVGGGAANVAVTGARSGLRTAAFFSVGDDEAGRKITEILRDEKVKVFTDKDKDSGTAYSTILLTETGERTVLVYRGASEKINEDKFPFHSLRTRWLYVVPGGLPVGFMERLIATAKKRKVKVAMNPSGHYIKMGKETMRPILRELDLVIVNREEAASLTGADYDDEVGIFKKFDEIVQGIAVMTDGANGVAVSDGKTIYRAGIFKERKVVDRTGAGDAFGSGFVSSVIKNGDNISEAIRIASANATSVVEYVGAETGILRTRDLKNERWRSLQVTTQKI